MVDAATTIRKQTNRRPFPLGISERESDSRAFFNFSAARKYGSGWIGQVIVIRWKCSATLTVKLNYAPNKNSIFFLLQYYPMKLMLYYLLSDEAEIVLSNGIRITSYIETTIVLSNETSIIPCIIRSIIFISNVLSYKK